MNPTARSLSFSEHWLQRACKFIQARTGLLSIAGLMILLVLTFANLTRFPVTWYDEGSHLHVPKTLVQTGVYADRSSEGFRYFGPTNGVGPTVMLPIALVFKVAGIGLLQARLVMAVYLLLSMGALLLLARQLGGWWLAVLFGLLLISAPGVSFLEYGRQVLGEVPGMFFLAAGLLVWFTGWEKPGIWRLIAAGALLGLSTITKNQYLLVIAPALLAGWILNLFYFRTVPQRVFLITGTITAILYAIWQVIVISQLGPGDWQENLALQMRASGGAAFVFSPALIRSSLSHLMGSGGYYGLVFVGLGYGIWLGTKRNQTGLRWAVLTLLVLGNLAWFSLAAISWLRYAFPGLVIVCLLMGKLFVDLWQGVPVLAAQVSRQVKIGIDPGLLQLGMVLVLAAIIAWPLAHEARPVFAPPEDHPGEMASYLNRTLPVSQVIETWEPELGFLTDHNFHYPPQALLNTAVGYVWLNGPAPADLYSEVWAEKPEYILAGTFSSWVQLYARLIDEGGYVEQHRVGPYVLYRLAR